MDVRIPGSNVTPDGLEIVRHGVSVRNAVSRARLEMPRLLTVDKTLAGRNRVYLQLENELPTGSFKFRRALSLMQSLSDAGLSSAVIVSAGNFGAACAEAAKVFNIRLHVVVPSDCPVRKREAISGRGANLIVAEGNFEHAARHAIALSRRWRVPFVSPDNNAHVIKGFGSMVLEVTQQLEDTRFCGQPITIVTPSIGGGSAAGMLIGAQVVSERFPNADIRLFGVDTAASPAMTASLKAGKIVNVVATPSIADSLQGNIEPDSLPFEIIRERMQSASVSETQIKAAMYELYTQLGLTVEGSGAATWAAFRAGLVDRTAYVVCVVSGQNVDPEVFQSVVEAGDRSEYAKAFAPGALL